MRKRQHISRWYLHLGPGRGYKDVPMSTINESASAIHLTLCVVDWMPCLPLLQGAAWRAGYCNSPWEQQFHCWVFLQNTGKQFLKGFVGCATQLSVLEVLTQKEWWLFSSTGRILTPSLTTSKHSRILKLRGYVQLWQNCMQMIGMLHCILRAEPLDPPWHVFQWGNSRTKKQSWDYNLNRSVNVVKTKSVWLRWSFDKSLVYVYLESLFLCLTQTHG